ncbi:alpha/beta hydrolase [Rhodococcus qingshengii]|uniref:alpha/beta hydrolase n=1 Tax=Rhodococcus qingshengii TaxID=334542 RepID=UPI001456017A|nr:alpha/beta hydrolase [Rhodococcus qingshengii]
MLAGTTRAGLCSSIVTKVGATAVAVLMSAGIASASVPVPQTPATSPGEPTHAETSYPTDHGPQAMTVYRPAGPAASHSPAIVMVHGGAWARGSRALLADQALQAAAAGFVVFNVDYELSAPRNPRQVEDVRSAIEYIHSHAEEFGIDADRIGGLGTSAGAHLLMQAVTAGRAPLKAVVGWSGPYDLTGQGSAPNAALALGAAEIYLGCLPDINLCNDLATEASPITHVAPGQASTLLLNSSNELIPLDQMTRFADRLRSVGTLVETRELPGSRHAVAYSAEAIGPTLEFLALHL